MPLNFERDDIGKIILERLGLHSRVRRDTLERWRNFVSKIKNPKGEVSIAVVGKYFDTGDFVLSDAYISVIEAIKHAAYKFGLTPNIHWLNSKRFETGDERAPMVHVGEHHRCFDCGDRPRIEAEPQRSPPIRWSENSRVRE